MQMQAVVQRMLHSDDGVPIRSHKRRLISAIPSAFTGKPLLIETLSIDVHSDYTSVCLVLELVACIVTAVVSSPAICSMQRIVAVNYIRVLLCNLLSLSLSLPMESIIYASTLISFPFLRG